MHKIAFIVAAATVAGMICGSARAADMAVPAYHPVVPVTAPASYNWTGLYFGINGGGGWGQQDPLNIITNRFDSISTSLSGGVLGGTMGVQLQVAHAVIGIETDLDWANIRGSSNIIPTVAGVPFPGATLNATTNIDWESTARFRAGYAAENLLFYGTGGLAILGAKTTLTTPAGGAVCGTVLQNCSGTDRQIGAALGGGFEYGFTPNLSGKIEYLYITAASLEISRHSEIRAGMNYRFGGM
jgi:outer membrane immunogenic protein